MVLVNLTIDCSRSLLVTLLDDVLLDNSGCNLFVNSGIVVTSLVPVPENQLWLSKNIIAIVAWHDEQERQTSPRPCLQAQAERHTGNK